MRHGAPAEDPACHGWASRLAQTARLPAQRHRSTWPLSADGDRPAPDPGIMDGARRNPAGRVKVSHGIAPLADGVGAPHTVGSVRLSCCGWRCRARSDTTAVRSHSGTFKKAKGAEVGPQTVSRVRLGAALPWMAKALQVLHVEGSGRATLAVE